MRTGIANLPMHWGKAPRWLFGRMTRLAREITIAIIDEYGANEMLKRLSDPYWFQSLGCVLGYDWHSSGLTTVTCGAIKEGIKGLEKDLDFFVAGGKGGTSRKTPAEIKSWGEKIRLKRDPEQLIYASKMSAKVDSSAIQDGYQLYHHNFFFTSDGSWAVIQQGMPSNLNKHKNSFTQESFNKIGYARRYHWLSDNVNSFVEEPQTGICDNKKYQHVLNLTSKVSSNAREVITQIARQRPDKIIKEYKKIINLNMPSREWIKYADMKPQNFEKVLLSTYENQPSNFEKLLGIKGIGPKSIRALTMITELAYGTKADWNDPVKYSFAHGGKDGYPYPVDKTTYDKSIQLLKRAIEKARLERTEKRTMQEKLLYSF
jgi:hypothetical protein